MMYFDIETAPTAEAAQYLPEATAPANYKDPDKIAAYIAEARDKALERAALDPGLLRIVAIGLQHDGFAPTATIAPTVEHERVMLAAFWAEVTTTLMGGGELVGYNVIGFDLPALITRSWLLGLAPAMSTVRRHGQHGVIDLMDRLSFGGIMPARGLSWWCQRIGIDVADDVKGSDIPGLVVLKDWTAIERHVLADIAKTVKVAAFCGVTRF